MKGQRLPEGHSCASDRKYISTSSREGLQLKMRGRTLELVEGSVRCRALVGSLLVSKYDSRRASLMMSTKALGVDGATRTVRAGKRA